MPDYSMAWPRAHALSRPAAVFRETPADFRVEEELGFTLTGEGEHLWVLVEKTGLNTADVVSVLSRISGCRKQDIGYAGLKDRQAVTRQWFSLKTTGTLATTEFDPEKIRLIEQVRNTRKCRLGSHRGNRFTITLWGMAADEAALAATTGLLASQGVPNYFGPQRFGREGANLARALALFNGGLRGVQRFKRGLYLSAARSFLFNKVLAARVTDGTWNTFVPGDVMALSGSGSVFLSEPGDPALVGRLQAGDIHPTGPLWGAGDLQTSDLARQEEEKIAGLYAELASGLVNAGLKQERRPLRVLPESLSLVPGEGGQLVVEFALPKGAYATSVLREMVTAAGL